MTSLCLWDVFSKDCHLRDEKERAYLEMAEKLGIAVVDIKAKIKLASQSLRSQVKRSLIPRSPTRYTGKSYNF